MTRDEIATKIKELLGSIPKLTEYPLTDEKEDWLGVAHVMVKKAGVYLDDSEEEKTLKKIIDDLVGNLGVQGLPQEALEPSVNQIRTILKRSLLNIEYPDSE